MPCPPLAVTARRSGGGGPAASRRACRTASTATFAGQIGSFAADTASVGTLSRCSRLSAAAWVWNRDVIYR